jgi:GDPmannose 4,6-dehydratase
MKSLIFGALGQDGMFLSEELLLKGDDVYGFVRNGSETQTPNGINGVTYISGDLLDRDLIEHTIDKYDPDFIYNLASFSSVKSSFDFPDLSEQINYRFVEIVLQILRERQDKNKRPIKFFQASSSEMFGPNPQGPLHENSEFNPQSPYALHKYQAHKSAIRFREEYEIPVYTAILFNHESHRRKPTFASRKITLGAFEIASGKRDYLSLGNIDSLRDWGYAGDYVKAMLMIMKNGIPDDFVVATGELHSLREICQIAFTMVGLGNYQPFITIDQDLIRKNDTIGLVGNTNKINNLIGWKPITSFTEMIAIMIKHEGVHRKY